LSILPIYIYNQSVLRKKAKPIRQADDSLKRLAGDMLETMHQASGIGLAANQVGSLQRVIVVDLSGMEEYPGFRPLAMLNPEVVSEEGSWVMEEGCLSIPDIREEVERAEKIRVRFRDLEYNQGEMEADGMLARVILHEIDHLDGILFIDHIGAVKRKLLRGRLNKLDRGEVEVNYPVVTNDGEGLRHSPLHAASVPRQ
jgi:peptide deformylase